MAYGCYKSNYTVINKLHYDETRVFVWKWECSSLCKINCHPSMYQGVSWIDITTTEL